MNRSAAISYAMPLLVLFAALAQSTVTVRLLIGGVKPDIVLIIILLSTLIFGGKDGVWWAFLGGLGLDLFSGGPLGLSSLGLMVVALIAATGHRALSRYHLLVPLGTGAIGTVTYGVVYVGVLAFLRAAAQSPLLAAFALPTYQMPFWETIQDVVLPAMIYNTTIILLLTPWLNRVPEYQGG